MVRPQFGDVCSPYEAIATIHYHADQCKDIYPKAAQVIKDDTYENDCLNGCKTEMKAAELYSDLVEVIKIGGFDLLKWATNSKALLDHIPQNQRAPRRLVCLDNDTDPLKALEDVFLFHQGDKLLQVTDPETKRSVVIEYPQNFSPPMGFFSPFTIRAKIRYQKLWLRGASWGGSLEEDIRNEWRKWKEELEHLNLIRISRSLLTRPSTEITSIQLHGYSDASPNAYGAVTYLYLRI